MKRFRDIWRRVFNDDLFALSRCITTVLWTEIVYLGESFANKRGSI